MKESGFRLPPGTTTTLNDITRRIDLMTNRLSVRPSTAALMRSTISLQGTRALPGRWPQRLACSTNLRRTVSGLPTTSDPSAIDSS